MRLLDVVGIMNGRVMNFTKIASDVALDRKTVRSYFQILEDTLLGRFIKPLPSKPGSRKTAPRF